MTIRATSDGPVATVTIARPGKRNALDRSMWVALAEAVRLAGADPDVRLVVLRGAGGDLSAGADLGDVLEATGSLEAARAYCSVIVDALLAVARCPAFTVAVVEGVAAGGGAELALAADLRLMADDATLTFPFARLGVVPDLFTVARLEALAGPGGACLALLGARPLTAEVSARLGIVELVVPPAGIDDELAALATAAGRGSGPALRSAKAMLTGTDALEVDHLVEAMARSFVSGEVAASAQRFLVR